jgi:LEA14-like dessication related protein
MRIHSLLSILIALDLLVLLAGCAEPPVRDPVVTVRDIALSDISLKTLTVNTTVVIFNPNAVGATLNRVAFDVYYRDGGDYYLGHGEKSGFDVRENGNTTVTIPVSIGNVPAMNAMASLISEGSLTLKVNGSAFIDVKVTSFEKKFTGSRTFRYEDFKGFFPVAAIAGINVTEGLQQLGGLLDAAAG